MRVEEIIVVSADVTVSPAPSSAARTSSICPGSHRMRQSSPSRLTSSAPASRAAIITSSSPAEPGSTTTPRRLNCHDTAPGSAIDPPVLEKIERMSEPVRLRLSVSTSTMIATPPGA